MNKNRLKNSMLMGIIGLLFMSTVQASIPVWTFAPVSGYPPTVSMNASEMATIKYTLTNQSLKPHTLHMKPIQGITPSGCDSSLGAHQSCILTLTINGSVLKGDILGGPILCDKSNPNQCYQPDRANSLAIRLTQAPPIQQYTVTSSAGSNGLINPSGAQTVNSGASLTFTATPSAGYGVSQWLVDSNLVQTGGTNYQLTNITANHSVSVTFSTFISSVTTLALSINCQPSSSCTTTQNAALTGNPRQITIQNTGLTSATNVSVSTSNLPSGTNISGDTCTGSTLSGGGACIITLTPGSTASSDSGSTACTSGTQPIEGTVTVTADGGLSTQINIYVLGYGCQYQGGFLYSVDDTTPSTGSMGGKVASLVDQAAPYITVPQATSIIWSSNGNGATPSDWDQAAILGIDESSTTSAPSPTSPPYPPGTPAFTACNGDTDGVCNSSNILSYYNFNRTSGGSAPTPLTYYAAGLCTATINTYSDWYLPAICELDAVSGGSGLVNCPSGMQSMVSSLSFLLGNPLCTPPSDTECLAGQYWSSTEFSMAPLSAAWSENFRTVGSSNDFYDKSYQFGVRCSRALT